MRLNVEPERVLYMSRLKKEKKKTRKKKPSHFDYNEVIIQFPLNQSQYDSISFSSLSIRVTICLVSFPLINLLLENYDAHPLNNIHNRIILFRCETHAQV